MKRASETDQARLALQAELDASRTKGERNRLGQFATPPALAMNIVQYATALLPPASRIRFLDPAFGTGAFYSALLQGHPSQQIESSVGFEIDPAYGAPTSLLWTGTQLQLNVSDFTRATAPSAEDKRFNLLVCNPPYVRHHHIKASEKRRLHRSAAQLTPVAVNGLAGLYCYFVALSHPWMATNAIAAWLIPSEFMDVNYGKPIRHYLLNRVELLRIHRFDPHEVQFADALVSSAVVVFHNRAPEAGHQVEFTFGGSLGTPRVSRMISIADLNQESKWTRFPLSSPRNPEASAKLSDFFTIRRGLATGHNTFFILSREQIDNHSLPIEFFRPILPSARYLRVTEVLAAQNGDPVLENQLFLLDCSLPEHEVRTRYPNLWAYLQMGEAHGVHKRYLCGNRSPWYLQERRPAPEFLCTYMGRGRTRDGRAFRFILNHSNATATNVYLLLYPKRSLATVLQANSDLKFSIWQYLNSIPTALVIGEGRVYGGGLHKLEPRELGNVPADGLQALVDAAPTQAPRQLRMAYESSACYQPLEVARP